MTNKDGFDKEKRWGNSAMKGYGVNSPAMMEARKGFQDKKKSVAKKMHPNDDLIKKESFKGRYGSHGMLQFSGPNAEKNKRADIKHNYKKEFK
jgi:hypothetical protein